MWKKIRVLILLVILLIVAINAYRDQNQDWTKPIFVVLHPINADGSVVTEQYIQQITIKDLDGVSQFLDMQVIHYSNQPIKFYFQLGQQLKQIPPKIPEQAGIFDVMWWSLKFRYYAWSQRHKADVAPTVTLFLNYYDPAKISVLKHSTALEKGRIGSVNLFASKKNSERNKVVLVHELLHALGASDKYDLATGQPIYPIGYAFPNQQPLFPQAKAELMAGYIPTSQTQSKMPESINETLIGDITATEIGWKP